jgi:hypothetical protein
VTRLSVTKHLVEIEPPPGFKAKTQEVEVKQGEIQKVVIKLDPMDITGVFKSEPPDAKVTLIVDGQRQPLGAAPARAPLDPRKHYEVVFEKDGYVTATKSITFGYESEIPVAVLLEKSAGGSRGMDRPPPPISSPDPVSAPREPREPRDPDPAEDPKPKKRRSEEKADRAEKADRSEREPEEEEASSSGGGGGESTLWIGAKPPCQIIIDGKDTGKTTPARDLPVKPGKHKITLINDEFKIKEVVEVTVKPGESKRVIKDFSSKMSDEE